jgi:hypothetical protein
MPPLGTHVATKPLMIAPKAICMITYGYINI